LSYQVQAADGLTVLGLSTRASNANPAGIGDLWRRFHSLGSQKIVTARLGETVYGIYCEYESDADGAYTVVIGCAVPPETEVSEEMKKAGMKKIDIAAGNFAVYRVEGELPQAVFNTWASIWQTPFDRRYQADFDRYGEDGSVTVHVGVR